MFLSQRTSPWESILASGMLMTGPQEVAWWKLIGPRHPSQPTTATSKPLSSPLLLPTPSLMLQCRATALMLMAGEDWDGFRSTSWSITTAMISNDSHKAFLLSVDDQGSERCIWMVFVQYILCYVYVLDSFMISCSFSFFLYFIVFNVYWEVKIKILCTTLYQFQSMGSRSHPTCEVSRFGINFCPYNKNLQLNLFNNPQSQIPYWQYNL